MSNIILINGTNETVRLAVFKKPVINPTLATIAWKIAEPPPGGQQLVNVPTNYTVVGNYSVNPNDPADLSCTTASIPFAETTAQFSIDSVTSQDRRATGAVINQLYSGLVLNEVRVTNNYGVGVQTSIAMDGLAIYEPQVVWPGGLFMEDVRATLYVAVIAQFTYNGQRLVQEEISQTMTPVLVGQSITVTGSMWKGYSLTAA